MRSTKPEEAENEAVGKARLRVLLAGVDNSSLAMMDGESETLNLLLVGVDVLLDDLFTEELFLLAAEHSMVVSASIYVPTSNGNGGLDPCSESRLVVCPVCCQ